MTMCPRAAVAVSTASSAATATICLPLGQVASHGFLSPAATTSYSSSPRSVISLPIILWYREMEWEWQREAWFLLH